MRVFDVDNNPHTGIPGPFRIHPARFLASLETQISMRKILPCTRTKENVNLSLYCKGKHYINGVQVAKKDKGN